MTEIRCRWAGSDQPRILADRHRDDCPDDTCRGCLPCPMDHCRVCGVTHAEQTCADCVAEVRENLAELVRMCDDLPDEAETKGVESEAIALLGPVADPEARGHLTASVDSGRVAPDYLGFIPRDKDGNPLPDRSPLWVLGTWAMVYRDAFGHDEPTTPATEASEAGYLARNLTEAAAEPWVAFEEFARDLRGAVTHIEQALHDGEQIDRGAPCMACGKSLERTWGIDATKDGWKCPRCKLTSTEAQYRFAVAHLHREEATHLTDRDMELRTGVKAGTVRKWAERGLVERRIESGRRVYSVSQVEAEATRRGLLAS